MTTQTNGTFPIQSKSPLIAAKQQCRPNVVQASTLRMSDQNDYLKPAKEVSKMMSSQSTTVLVKKAVQDPFSTMQMQEVLEGKNSTFNIANTNPCLKHPKKKAKYYIKDSQKVEMFCSKCALEYAMKGCKVEKFLNKEEKYRKNIIDDFLGKITDAKTYCNQVKVSLIKQKSESAAIQAFRLANLKEFFSGLENLINEERERIISEVQTNDSKTIGKIQTEFENVGEINCEIERFQDDINQNYAKIINKMELDPFLEIMQKYHEKLKVLTEAVKISGGEDGNQDFGDFRRTAKDFFENLRNLIRVFIGLNSRTRRNFEEENENGRRMIMTERTNPNELNLPRQCNDLKQTEIANKTIDLSHLNVAQNTSTQKGEPMKDRTIEVTNRKPSFSNKENQEKNIENVHTQRNPVTNEHIYSNILNHITGVKKMNPNMKGFFSGVGKNYKTVNDNNKGEKTGKNQHFETRIATIHVPLSTPNNANK